MTYPDGVARTDARTHILAAAERLIAERGASVPLRDIAVAAEQRNSSAVQYHFGSRDGLIEAVIDERMAGLEARRLELLAEREAASGADDLAGLVDLLVTPLLELSQRGEATHYARFLEAVRSHAAVAEKGRLSGADRAAVRIVVSRLDRLLSDLPAAARRYRLAAMTTAMFALLADYERAVEAAENPRDPEIVQMLVGLLTARAVLPA